jgi:hypothetical protein
MPDNPLPDDIPEIGYIVIQLGLDETGIVPAYDYDGVTPEAAVGYLTTFADMIREGLKATYAIEWIDEEDEEEPDASHE